MRPLPVLSPIAAAVMVFAASCAMAATATQVPSSVNSGVERRLSVAKAALLTSPDLAIADAKAVETSLGPAGDRGELAESILIEAQGEIRAGHIADAEKDIGRGLSQVGDIGQLAHIKAELLLSKGFADLTANDTKAALKDLQSAFELADRLKLPVLQARSLQQLGNLYYFAREYETSIKYYNDAREFLSNDVRMNAIIENNIGLTFKAKGDPKAALPYFRSALAVAQKLGLSVFEYQIQSNVVEAEVETADLASATSDAQRLLELSKRSADPSAARFAYGDFALVLAAKGQNRRAAQWFSAVFKGLDFEKTGPEFLTFHQSAANVFGQLRDYAEAYRNERAAKRIGVADMQVAASADSALSSAQFDRSLQDLKIERLKSEQLQRRVEFETAQNGLRTVLAMVIGIASLVFVAGSVVAFRAMKRSRDAVRRTNLELEQTNSDLEVALRAKGDFLAVTSHEIRTPLNGIMGIAEILLLEKGLPERVKSRLEVLYRSGVAMKHLVDDLLDASKAATSTLTPDLAQVNFKELVSGAVDTWRDTAESKGLRLDLECGSAPEFIKTDGPRLRQVILNLISNAVKFTDHGGVRVTADLAEDALRVVVADTGIGIAPQDQSRIFEVFTQVDMGLTRRFSGAGLGLSISRQIVSALGGLIQVESREGEGSTFTIILPLAETTSDSEVGPRDGQIEEVTLARRRRVLALEPNPLSAAFLRSAARAADIDIEVNADGEDLLATVEFGGVDLVLLPIGAVEPIGGLRRRLLGLCAEKEVAFAFMAPKDGVAPGAPLTEEAGALGNLATPVTADAMRHLMNGLEARMLAGGNSVQGVEAVA